MNNKTFKAQITVMAALSMTIIFSLICTCVRSALDCFYNTQIKEACMLSVEGAFSAYHNDMLSDMIFCFFNIAIILRQELNNMLKKIYIPVGKMFH